MQFRMCLRCKCMSDPTGGNPFSRRHRPSGRPLSSNYVDDGLLMYLGYSNWCRSAKHLIMIALYYKLIALGIQVL